MRMRHFRGHGVHSPYVYALVREVFMKRRNAVTGDPGFERALVAAGLSLRAARELQQICRRCGCKTWGVDREGDGMTCLTRAADGELCRRVLLQARAEGHTCLLYTSPSPRDQRGSRMPSSA